MYLFFPYLGHFTGRVVRNVFLASTQNLLNYGITLLYLWQVTPHTIFILTGLLYFHHNLIISTYPDESIHLDRYLLLMIWDNY